MKLSKLNYISLTLIIGNILYNKSFCAPNIIFLIIDDLRPTLSCFGDKTAITPNIDQIASNGFIFTNAFAQVLVKYYSKYLLF